MVTFVSLSPRVKRPLNYSFVETIDRVHWPGRLRSLQMQMAGAIPGAETLLVELERTWEITEPSGTQPCTSASPEQDGRIPAPRLYPGPFITGVDTGHQYFLKLPAAPRVRAELGSTDSACVY